MSSRSAAGYEALAFSADGQLLAAGRRDGVVEVWDVDRGKVRFRLKGHEGAVGGLAFAPQGNLLATGGADRLVRLWTFRGEKPAAVLEGHARAVRAAAFTADGKSLTTAAAGGEARLWDVRAALEGKREKPPLPPPGPGVPPAAPELKVPKSLQPIIPPVLPRVVAGLGPTRSQKRLFLEGKPAERAEVEADLLQKGPMLAVYVRAVWLPEVKDPAGRERLESLLKKLLADSPDNARRILRHAESLHSVAANVGPLKLDPVTLSLRRMDAKLFHYFFVEPERYAKEINSREFGRMELFTPYIDLPGAMQLYTMAGEMYGRLARQEKDPKKAREYRAQEDRCRKAAEGIRSGPLPG
jgi:hypothetical protein